MTLDADDTQLWSISMCLLLLLKGWSVVTLGFADIKVPSCIFSCRVVFLSDSDWAPKQTHTSPWIRAPLQSLCLMNRSNKAESPNLPNHQGMSAGIPAKLGPHPARKNQGVPKCPKENSGRKSIQYSTYLHYKSSIFYSRIIKALPLAVGGVW